MRAFAVCSAIAMNVALASTQQAPAGRYSERVDVERVLVDARVLDDGGRAIVGLGAHDFAVKIGGKPVAIESAMWVGGSRKDAGAAPPAAGVEPGLDEDNPGRLIVFLFQKDLEPSRLTGLMRMLVESRNFLDELTAHDRIAVVSFDYHLKVWLDFTNDRDAVRRVLREILFRDPPPVPQASGASLARGLDSATASKTYSIEKALHRIADALHALPGSKSVVLIGHGFGRLGWSGVMMEHGYEDARDALMAARTSVFSLDVTNADYHSLEKGLQLVSRETGGYFARTHLFTAPAMNRLSGVLAGYYVLFLEQPDVTPGTHKVDVSLTRRKGTVLARDSYRLER